MARLLRRALWTLVWCALAGVLLSASLVLALRRYDPPTSAFMLRARVAAMFEAQAYQMRYEWRDIAQISPQLAIAVVASEDQQFPWHNGFDFRQIRKAMQDQRGASRGASTISQQVAKNLFLWSGRSWLRKGLEAWCTLLIEWFWPKQRILEVYLNIAQFGRGTYGAEAAAQRFFSKSAKELNLSESALLAAVLPNPLRLRADKPSQYVQRRRGEIGAQMRALGGPRYLGQSLTRAVP
ncbi:MAG: monofunctional biosynthetic peptidoglycan transglycosylase [Steroidobacteraceae bacterium]